MVHTATREMHVNFRAFAGGEDLDSLRESLARALPDSSLEEVIRTEKDQSRRFLWRHPIASAYGEDAFRIWKIFRTCVRSAWGTAGDVDLADLTFIISDNGHPLGRLERRRDAGGVRDYLSEVPLSCGTGIDLLMPDGSWLPGRYEVGWPGGEPVAMFYVGVWGGEGCFCIRDSMVLRFPHQA